MLFRSNVVGPHFIGVHTMLDPQAASVNEMIDQLAERITTLGGSPDGRPGTIVKQREWDDYSLGRDLVEKYIEKRGGKPDHPNVRWEEFGKLLASPRLPSGLKLDR